MPSTDGAATADRLAALDPARRALLRKALGEDARPALAIVGMAVRAAGAPDLERFWELLCAGRVALGAPDGGRDLAGAGHGTLGLLDAVHDFDPAFFRLSTAEAAQMDPQHRLLLELAWEALEDAALSPDRIAARSIGVFVGVASHDHERFQYRHQSHAGPFLGIGSAGCMAANRISYHLDLRGPSLTVDTACSSSLVALQLAVDAIRLGRCRAALVGGVNLILTTEIGAALDALGIVSRSGSCRPFAADADGFVRGEGGGMIAIRPLVDAVAAGDRIYATVAGCAVNQDGRSNGLTAPSPAAQVAVIGGALREAGVAPEAVRFVECSAVGSPSADRIEARSLSRALRTDGSRPLAVGSVKANVGHLEAASGAVALVKVALAVHHGAVPPGVHPRAATPPALAELGLRIPADPVDLGSRA
jgi:acyl transferase domain-containing protein